MIEIIPNTKRPTREETYLAIAEIISQRSTCKRGHVGCVITMENRIITTGYNGTVKKDKCTHCNLDEPCTEAVHAEANAIAFAAKDGISIKGATLYCTHCPCHECAKLIIQSGITNVVYKYEYRKIEGYHLLRLMGINVREIHGKSF